MRKRILAAFVGLCAGTAQAEPTLPPPESPPEPADRIALLRLDDTFRYEDEQPPHRLRALGELGALLSTQFVFYVTNGSPSGERYEEIYSPLDKLFGGAVTLDANPIRTNLVGHPLLGAAYFQMARGNRLRAWESALWATAASTAWELAEYRETASLNDLVITPAAGVALGEPLFQLGAHLDRLPRSTGREALSWIVSPWKKLGDWMDDARPARGGSGDALAMRGWGLAGVADFAGIARVQLGGGVEWTLIRDPDYGAAGHDTRALLDAQATGLSLAGAFSSAGVDDARLDSWVLLAAVYAREIAPGRRGGDLLAGAGLGYDLRIHDWGAGGARDAWGLVHVPRLTGAARWLAGDLTLGARIDTSLAFGGVRSFALDGDSAAVPVAELPTVQQEYGYHFAIGPALRAALEVRWEGLTVAATARGDWLSAVLEPDPTPGAMPTARLDDRWLEAGLRLGWRFRCGLEVGAEAERGQRWSRAGDVTRTETGQRIAVTVGVAEGS